MDIIIKNGLIITASEIYKADIGIKNGIISEISLSIEPNINTKVIDAKDKYIFPGIIDAHVHFQLNMSGTISNDDFENGTKSAAYGGVTTVIDYATQEKGKQLLEAIDNRKREAQGKVCIDYSLHAGITDLLKNSCFAIELVDLHIDEHMVYIKLDGEDAALMIGKEGYRYKALSYILHNWIKIKYDKNISLEIAEFLKNQDIMIEEYLQSVKERIDEVGEAQTKPLDGILVKLALEKLRTAYPEKYVAIRTIRDGRKIVIVNAYRKDK